MLGSPAQAVDRSEGETARAADAPSSTPIPEPRISEFILGPGDTVEITIYRHDDLNRKTQIQPDHTFFFPLVGNIDTRGMGLRQLRLELTERLSKFFIDPQVSVEITASPNRKIFVLGEVNTPGVYQFDTPTSAVEAISRAGGFTRDAKQRSVLLVRGDLSNPELRKLDFKLLFRGGAWEQNAQLMSGDLMYVPATSFANVERFFVRIERIIRPIVYFEQSIAVYPQVQDALHGKNSGRSVIVVSPP
ncbi:MAG: hypothetical protein DMF51_03660 [Acidobacteria bacterium]|nr:MAG: hypothetical protein DMF51_03660 [Acidobacteriota bacterium]